MDRFRGQRANYSDRNRNYQSNGRGYQKRGYENPRNFSGRRNRSPSSDSNSSPVKRVKLEDEGDMAPWITSKTKKINSSLLRFHCEIFEFTSYILPSAEEHKRRVESFEKLKVIIEQKIEGSQVLAFGSFKTQMYLPDADIDIVFSSSLIKGCVE